MKITVPSALLTTFLFGGSGGGRNGGIIVRAFSSRSCSSSSVTAVGFGRSATSSSGTAAAAAGGIRAGLRNTKTIAAAATAGATSPGGTKVTTTPTNARPTKLTTTSSTTTTTIMEEMINMTDVFIFDCDGVIWRGDSIIEGIHETLTKLRALGKRCYFVTNNSTKSRAGYKSKFDSLGLADIVSADSIFSSSFAAAAYLDLHDFKATGKKVYIIGEVGIQDELDLLDIPYIGGPDDKDKVANFTPGSIVEHDNNVGAVIVGLDRNINYYKIQYAQLCINENPGCLFIATNTDAVTHLTDAQEWAGNGSMVGAIKGCTGREPIVVGKPSPLMIDYLCNKLQLSDRKRICMVGDRLDTDVLFGTENGLQSLLVLSGVTSEAKLLSDDNTITPDYYTDSIADFFR